MCCSEVSLNIIARHAAFKSSETVRLYAFASARRSICAVFVFTANQVQL
jgi:hypothetical protein